VPRTRLSLGVKRGIAAVWLVWFLFCAGNYYLGWGFFGQRAKLIMVLSLLVFAIVFHRYQRKIMRELKAYERLKRMRKNERLLSNASIERLPPNNRWRGP
jgi:hypothetical protein